ncbi:sensor histidine kinase [Brevibacillus sp. HB1.2]|uniref:sensor histidine kinase n=1 Tax=unclassified Brevibacillus TaxID=2684853 RepID=UPI0015751A6D|nr:MULTISPECIES: histidine kinase [unclassified Brevibacillus]NTU21222.1 sensor histidine kinase [Brevibacillus sp. HB1.2]NTU30693.1 sensor histidine kinase [Brevibacillus sp. HB1.1]
MALWTMANKTAVLGFIIVTSFLAHPTSEVDPWQTLVYLLYLAINLTILILKQMNHKQWFVWLSIMFVIASGLVLDPLFMLLLPINVLELAFLAGKQRMVVFLCMLLPLFMVPSEWVPLYLLTAFLSFLLYRCGSRLTDKLGRLEAEREKLREDLQSLTRSLNESSEYFRQSTYTIQLEERNRLSQQIHDDVGHAVAGALIQMEASRLLMATDQDKASELLRNAITISKEGLERIRVTLKEVKPRPEELGINRLRSFVDELSARETVTATLTFAGDIDVITPLQWKIIQQNATEAVTNALKYAKATVISLEVRVLNTFIKAVVTDNGAGAEKIVKGLGILGMEERAASAGGTVIVDGTRGFSVTTLLPYRNE